MARGKDATFGELASELDRDGKLYERGCLRQESSSIHLGCIAYVPS